MNAFDAADSKNSDNPATFLYDSVYDNDEWKIA